MRKRFVRVVPVLFFLSLFFFAVTVFGQEVASDVDESSESFGASEKMIAEPDFDDHVLSSSSREPGFLGQNHNYSVVFRGNGEAVVSAKIVFTNTTEENLNEISLRIPKVNPSEISVYQVIRGSCSRYYPREIDSITGTYKPLECAQYADYDYYQSYYSNAKYQKAEYELDIDTLKITLPRFVKSNKSGAFFVYYRAMGYAKKNIFGSFNYTFETLKAEDSIRNLRVGISTDSDLILRGVEGEVEYRFESPALMNLESTGAAMAPQKSAAIDSFVSSIGRGKITKTASNLAALESYSVKGAYAPSRLKLYAKEISIFVAAMLAFVAILVLVIRAVLKKLKKGEVTDGVEKPETKEMSNKVQLSLIALGVSFVSSLLTLFYTAFVYFIVSAVGGVFGYRYYGMLIIFLIIISFAVYAVLILGPGIYYGVKKGVGWGIATIVLTIFWLVFYLVVTVLVIFLFGSGRNSPVYPLMEAVGM